MYNVWQWSNGRWNLYSTTMFSQRARAMVNAIDGDDCPAVYSQCGSEMDQAIIDRPTDKGSAYFMCSVDCQGV